MPLSLYWQLFNDKPTLFTGCIGPNEPTPEYMRKFDEIVCEFLREQGVPGGSLCITHHGRPVYSQGNSGVVLDLMVSDFQSYSWTLNFKEACK